MRSPYKVIYDPDTTRHAIVCESRVVHWFRKKTSRRFVDSKLFLLHVVYFRAQGSQGRRSFNVKKDASLHCETEKGNTHDTK